MRKVCFVVQRYGLEVNGGAEHLCRLYCERMVKHYDITVLTSCAVDHVTWKNEYKSGPDMINGVRLVRFPSVVERDIEKFSHEMLAYFNNPDRDFYDDFSWQYDNGPACPDMHRYILDHKDEFDVFVFVGYLYYSTTFCLHEVSEKSILISTAHDELPLNGCGMFHGLFNLPAAFVYLTEEERLLVNQKFGNEHIPSVTTGAGIDLPDMDAIDAQNEIYAKNGFSKEDHYLVYLGRIEPSKSCDTLLEAFIRYKDRYGGDEKFILAGKLSMLDIPKRDDIIWVGFVSEEEKFALIKHADALMLGSKLESLSLVVLEAMELGIPVIVNAQGPVLKGHVDRSNAGLYFWNDEQLVRAIKYMAENPEMRKALGQNGKQYMKEYYKWEIIEQKMIDIIEKVAANGA
ncbi:MAG: glycosyltransferase family 4 protein [Christensenellaceae bacterium]